MRPGLRRLRAFSPDLRAVLLTLGAGAAVFLVDTALLPYGFPWASVSLLVVGAAAVLWGVRPAIVSLALSCLFGDVIIPDLHISYFQGHPQALDIRLVRTLLFAVTGGLLIWLAERARRMQARAERRGEVARILQATALPGRLPDVPGCEASAAYRPALQEEEVGGDFYDLFPLDATRERYGLLLGDVMGKGKEAAAHTALLRFTLRAYLAEGMPPAQALSRLSALLGLPGTEMSLATVFLGVLDPAAGGLRYANAGHEPPCLLHGDGSARSLPATGPLIGVLADAVYTEDCVRLQPGDRLLIVTDGVTEARSPAGEFLGQDGLLALLRAVPARTSAAPAVAGLQAALDEFTAGRQHDDIALLLLRYDGPSQP